MVVVASPLVVSSAASLTVGSHSQSMLMYPHASECVTSHELCHELDCTDEPRSSATRPSRWLITSRATLAAMDASAVVCVRLRDSRSGWLRTRVSLAGTCGSGRCRHSVMAAVLVDGTTAVPEGGVCGGGGR
jgi:hypothetical protein